MNKVGCLMIGFLGFYLHSSIIKLRAVSLSPQLVLDSSVRVVDDRRDMFTFSFKKLLAQRLFTATISRCYENSARPERANWPRQFRTRRGHLQIIVRLPLTQGWGSCRWVIPYLRFPLPICLSSLGDTARPPL